MKINVNTANLLFLAFLAGSFQDANSQAGGGCTIAENDAVSCLSDTTFTCPSGAQGTVTCPTVRGEATVCFGGTGGFGEIAQAAISRGPCLQRPRACTAVGTFSYGTNACGAFYICSRDPATGSFIQDFGSCPNGQDFNDATDTCESPQTAGCANRNNDNNTRCRAGERRVADPTSCRHYYTCGLLGRRFRVRCHFNMRYDTVTRFCNRRADCGSRPLN